VEKTQKNLVNTSVLTYNGKEVRIAFNYGGLAYAYFVGYSNKDVFVFAESSELLESK